MRDISEAAQYAVIAVSICMQATESIVYSDTQELKSQSMAAL